MVSKPSIGSIFGETKVPQENRLESLSGNRESTSVFTLIMQYRICFSWGKLGSIDVEITNYH